MTLNDFFEAKKEYAIILLRVVTGCRLIAGVWGSIISWEQMLEVKSFFQQNNIPLPVISAVSAVYAEFICGFLFITGLWVRQAALIMIFIFIVAIVFVDIHNTFIRAFPAWVILAASVAFLFLGAGKFSIDKVFSNKKQDIL